MIQEQLEKAAHANNDDKAQIIRDLAAQPNALQEALYVFSHAKKHLWGVAVRVINAIGYPKNAQAIPLLVDIASDMNAPGREAATETLVELGVPVVVPYLIVYLLDKERHQYWGFDVEGMCLMLASINREFAVLCGPTLVYILNQIDSVPPGELDKEYLIDVLEKIGADCAAYALPTLIIQLQREGTSGLGKRLRRLITSFGEDALQPYRFVMDMIKS